MNSSTSSSFVLRLTRGLLITSLLTLNAVAGATFEPGDEVKLIRDEALYFRDQVFQQGKTGETFSVLADRPETQKVFVSAKDHDGKQIALSLPEAAVALVPVDVAKARTGAIAAAKNGHFAEGLQMVDHALHSNPKEPTLQQTAKAIGQLQTAVQTLTRIKADQQQVMVEATRKRKNADVADHPNNLNARDTSGQDRARQMRAEADQAEASARTALEEANKIYQASLKALTSEPTVAKTSEGEKNPPSIPGSGPGPSPAEINSPPAKEVELDQDSFRKVPLMQDKFGEPPNLKNVGPPSYAETIEYLKGKIDGYHTLGFGVETQKMIYRSTPDVPEEAFAFDPATLNAEVTYTTKTQTIGNTAHTDYTVVLNCRNNRLLIKHVSIFQEPGDWNGIPIAVADEFTAKKVATAFSHLIQMFGGEKEAF